jgi:alpha-beta hydrolase superfamily lysophospholipase
MRNQETETPSAVPVASLAVSPARGVTRAVVLVLPGGKAMSRDVTATRQASVLRMLPFSWRIRRRTRRQGVAVWRLRYRYRGWNGAEASPVTDARWALDEVRRRHGPVPVVLLGHSMGGRVAAHVAGDPLVSGLVLLAPWLPSHEPFRVRAGVPVCVLHGDQDRITSAAASTAWAERARRAGADVSVFVIPGGEHFMLRHLLTWHRLATDEVLRGLRAAFLREQPQAAGRGRA